MFYMPSGFWKRNAKAALKNHWLTAILIALVVELPSLLVQGIGTVTGNDLIGAVQNLIYTSMNAEGTAIDADRVVRGLQELSGRTGIWVIQGLRVVAWLITPCLTMGMVAWMLALLRKQPAGDVSAVFSRIGLFWKGIRLRLYVAWRVFVHMLPGLGVSMLSLLPLLLNRGNDSQLSMMNALNTAMGIQSAAMIVSVVLGLMAALKYSLSDMVLADNPDMGPVAAAKESRRMTQGKKGQIFSLYISFVLWYLLQMMAVSMAYSMFGSVVSLMVEMLAALAITVYLKTSVSAFYLGCRAMEGKEQRPLEAESEEETEIQDELN